jgi:hypothetical protein
MATAAQAGTQDRARIHEHDAIAAVLQLYMDGAAHGDADKLRQAFHEDARTFGSIGGQRFDVPVRELFHMAEQAPADVDGSYRGRIVAINHFGDAANAIVAEDGYWGCVSFVDFFNLSRVDGRWLIVDKTFAHTGGTLPAS